VTAIFCCDLHLSCHHLRVGYESTEQPPPLAHLITIYVARRDLVPVLKREVLDGERDVTIEEAIILFDFYRAQTGEMSTLSIDSQRFATLKQIELTQVLSQQQVHRRVAQLLLEGRGYLENKVPRTKTGPMEVRLTDKGVAFAQQYWTRCKKFASAILATTNASQLSFHLSVNFNMQQRIHGWAVPRPVPSSEAAPAENLMSILLTAKDIRLAIEDSVVLPEDKLSVERADLLVFLHGSPGFRSFGEIERSLVHSFSPSRHLISRWVGQMGPEGDGYVETRPLVPGGKRMAAAITKKGTTKVEAILRRYHRLAEMLIDGIPEQEREAHLLVNRTISDSIKPRLKDLIAEGD
jgi:hypothetical protein